MSNDMMNKLQEIANRRKSGGAGKGANANSFFKPDYGSTKIRFLPAKQKGDVFFKEFGEHWVEKKPYICPKLTLQKPCPICEAVNDLYNSGTDEDVALARQFKARRQHYANVIVRGREDDGPKVFKFGVKLSEKLIHFSLHEDYYDLSDPVKGFDFRIEKDKKDGFPNYDNSMPVRDASSIDEEDLEKWLDSAVDIHALVDDRIQSYDEIKAQFTGASEIDDNGSYDDSSESFDEDDFISRVNNATGN